MNYSEPWFCHHFCSLETFYIYLLTSLDQVAFLEEMVQRSPFALHSIMYSERIRKGKKRLNSTLMVWMSFNFPQNITSTWRAILSSNPGPHTVSSRQSAQLLLIALGQYESSVTNVSDYCHSGTYTQHTASFCAGPYLAPSSTTQEIAHVMSPI